MKTQAQTHIQHSPPSSTLHHPSSQHHAHTADQSTTPPPVDAKELTQMFQHVRGDLTERMTSALRETQIYHNNPLHLLLLSIRQFHLHLHFHQFHHHQSRTLTFLHLLWRLVYIPIQSHHIHSVTMDIIFLGKIFLMIHPLDLLHGEVPSPGLTTGIYTKEGPVRRRPVLVHLRGRRG